MHKSPCCRNTSYLEKYRSLEDLISEKQFCRFHCSRKEGLDTCTFCFVHVCWANRQEGNFLWDPGSFSLLVFRLLEVEVCAAWCTVYPAVTQVLDQTQNWNRSCPNELKLSQYSFDILIYLSYSIVSTGPQSHLDGLVSWELKLTVSLSMLSPRVTVSCHPLLISHPSSKQQGILSQSPHCLPLLQKKKKTSVPPL